ncbi:peptidoglycan-binding domain-containing protein [Hyalangium gracile]|uniref:peptidoglycan-binding domain-containing protein n=1 Tax=Hyalangium gracile TaxID=394092 RepID=UPI001CC9AFC3|nr:peptidoglycan-binding protein [Hyalangium gracile]
MPPSLPPLPGSSCASESPSALKQGVCGPDVEQLQRQLEAAGFEPGPVDGIFGAKTKAALMAFQRARGLEVDGIVGSRTWAALDMRRGSGLRPILKRGVCEGSVVVLQKVLATHGFDPGARDGLFGPKTERAVLAFQRAKGLEADGVVGPKTWNALGMTAPRSFPLAASPVQAVLPARTESGRSYPV